MFLSLLITTLTAIVCAKIHSIEDFGAVAGEVSDATALKNAAAIVAALQAANATADGSVAWVPPNKNFYIFHVECLHLNHVTLQIDGNITVNSNQNVWLEVCGA